MLLYPFFFLLSLGQIGRLSFLNQEVNINLFDILLLGLLGWWLIRYRLKPIKESLPNLKFIYVFIGWLGATYLLSVVRYTQTENIIALLYLLRLSGYFLFFIYLSYSIGKEKVTKNSLEKAVILFSGVTLIFSVVQYFLYSNLRNLAYLGWDPHQGRVFGTFFDTSAAAAVFGLMLIFFFFQKQSKKYIFLIPFLILGLLTYSRGFYLSMLLTAAIYFLFKRNYKVIIAVIACFALLLLLLPKQFGEGTNLTRTFSIESRLTDEKEGLNIASQNPLFGVGYNHLRYSRENVTQPAGQPESHAGASFHSSFLIVLATSGIVGLLLFIVILISLGGISEVSRYYVIFLGFFSLFDNILLYPLVTVLFLGLMAFEAGKNKKLIFRT